MAISVMELMEGKRVAIGGNSFCQVATLQALVG